MNLADTAIRKKTFTFFSTLILAFAGIYAYFQLGHLEDPEFTVKTAIITTRYPGASPQEVEEEVTEVIEKAVQQLPELDKMHSLSKMGLSIVFVDIEDSYSAGKLPQIWDKLRKKITDVQPLLPPGAMKSMVNDDFGDVYGILLAVTGDGFSYAELKKYVKSLERELLLVKDVAKTEAWGTQQECVYIEASRAHLSGLGISPQAVIATLKHQNMVVDAGSVDSGRERIRIAPTGSYASVEEIGDLIIRGYPSDQLIYLKDLARVKRGYLDPPGRILRFNGKPAIALAISTVTGGNVVKMGEAVKKRLNELMEDIPVGIEIGIVSLQSDTVKKAINTFMLNFIEAILIVFAVLLVAMGLRSGLLIGSGLVLTILVTFVVMKLMEIDLQRVSLGSLIIALGMLVDNSIVITEAMLIKMQKGTDRLKAAKQATAETGWPLLGATLIAVFAFFAIYISKNVTGEYCRSLFLVVAISLLASWLLAMTVTPLCCYLWLRIRKDEQGRDPYDHKFFHLYRMLLETALNNRLTTIGLMLFLFAASVVGFMFVDKTFFPASARPQLMVDYWLPEGSRIQNVSEDMKKIEVFLLNNDMIESIASFVGSGPPRFYLPNDPELPSASYGQIIINVKDERNINDLIAFMENYLDENFPYAEPTVREFPLGPPVKFKIEVRFRGQDPVVLRQLSENAKEIMARDPQAKEIRDDWRHKVKKIVPKYYQPYARKTMISREDLAVALKKTFEGIPVGIYREHDELLPIIFRPPLEERIDLENLNVLSVFGQISKRSVPLGQVVSEINTEWEDPIIRRKDRQRCITAQCNPRTISASTLRERLIKEIESIELPPGYELEWGGEYDSSLKAEKALFAGIPVAFVIMALIIVALFNSFRQPLIIVLILPLAMIGITAGLLLTLQPFGFLALVGALSLIGMIVKNAVVLIDQIDKEIQTGKDPYLSVVDSSVSRLRPILMASLTTVLGISPLIFDRFFRAMAVTIMSGLTFATVLTLIVVPVVYTSLFKIGSPEK